MKDKFNTTMIIILYLLVGMLFILFGYLAIKNAEDNILNFCSVRDWQGSHLFTISGTDVSFDVDCKTLWEDNFAYGKWEKKCSVRPFDTKPSCDWLCIQDCAMINKQAGEVVCVC